MSETSHYITIINVASRLIISKFITILNIKLFSISALVTKFVLKSNMVEVTEAEPRSKVFFDVSIGGEFGEFHLLK